VRSITNILFPVDFSPSCIAMATYVKRGAALLLVSVMGFRGQAPEPWSRSLPSHPHLHAGFIPALVYWNEPVSDTGVDALGP